MMHGWGFGGMGGAGGLGGALPRFFQEDYHCYSVAYADKAHLEKGDKILLPPSAFDTLARCQVDYPMLFQLTAGDRTTHSGVLEFTAEEGCVYIPFWMMQNLLIEEGALLSVKNVSLPKATFVKLQPQSVDFLEISNPRAVLEHALRNYSCVTLHDIIQLPYNGKNYHFELKDVQPSPAACIIETDCNVDFDAPVGYQEPVAAAHANDATATNNGGSAGNGNSNGLNDAAAPSTPPKPPGIRIVNGVVVRPDTSVAAAASSLPLDLLAERTGGTGIQPNAAITQQQAAAAPAVEYWAVAAGSGNRLDGKAPTPLKAANGQEINVDEVRAAAAEAAAKRASEAQAKSLSFPANGNGDADGAVPSKRKSKVGNKFSRLKQTSAFQGDAKNFGK